MSMKSIKEVQLAIEEKYRNLVKSQIGVDVDKLTLKNSGVVIKNCSKCRNPFEVMDFGLHEDNVALYWIFLHNKVSSSNYCAGIKSVDDSNRYIFCYNLDASNAIESVIKTSGKIRTAAYAAERVKMMMQQRLDHHKEVMNQYLEKIFHKRYEKEARRRQKMWHRIDNELKRTSREIIGGKKIISLGHYHLLTVLRKFGAIISLSGTLNDTLKFQRKCGFLSHVGWVIFLSTSPLRIKIHRVREGFHLSEYS